MTINLTSDSSDARALAIAIIRARKKGLDLVIDCALFELLFCSNSKLTAWLNLFQNTVQSETKKSSHVK